MSATVTSAEYLAIKMLNEDGGTSTLKIDNPRSNLTRSEVVNAFSDTLAARILTNSSGINYLAVGTTEFVEETIRREEVE